MTAVKPHIINNDKTKKKTKKKEITRKYFNPMTEGVRWSEKYKESLERFFLYLPGVVTKFIATLAIFTFGATLKVGGFLHWYFYVQRRDSAKEWKIQPDKWLSPELELHEIMVGCLALLITGSYSAVLACYIANGNPSMVYYQYDEYGWWWFFLQVPVIFIYQDYTTYILHRMYHTPFLYKNFHKLHHKYKQPTAFSVTAIHPVEIMHVQLTMCLPLFTIPVHWMPFYVVALYTYYHGIIDHSGINFKALWWQPWQPDADFHDKHHQYFHVNFGFNIKIWDTLHGTAMKKHKKYSEETFHDESAFRMTAGTHDEVPERQEIIDQNGNATTKLLPEANGKNGIYTNGRAKKE